MTVSFDPPARAVTEVVARALTEDLPDGDVSARLVPEEAELRCSLVAREPGVLAGSACVVETFSQVDRRVELVWVAADGEEIVPGESLADIRGSARSILTGERTALNLLCHLSGIATITRRFAEAAAATGRAKILDTRKTTPGMRFMEKAAVRAGGGMNHRMSLSDMILLKDNHLAAIGVRTAIDEARRQFPKQVLRVEVECDTIDQVIEAVEAGADMVMLDNMSTEEVRACVEKVALRCPLEVSGGVTLENVRDYSATGVDYISVGALTHSAPALDIGLDCAFFPGGHPNPPSSARRGPPAPPAAVGPA